jgi:hypothetical protein
MDIAYPLLRLHSSLRALISLSAHPCRSTRSGSASIHLSPPTQSALLTPGQILAPGLDYTGSINRLRFDMEAAPIYATVVAQAGELLQRAGLDWVQVDEIVYAGGSACLSGLDAVLVVRLGEDTTTPFITTKETQACVRQPSLTLCRFSSNSDKVHSRLQRRLKQIGRSRI